MFFTHVLVVRRILFGLSSVLSVVRSCAQRRDGQGMLLYSDIYKSLEYSLCSRTRFRCVVAFSETLGAVSTALRSECLLNQSCIPRSQLILCLDTSRCTHVAHCRRRQACCSVVQYMEFPCPCMNKQLQSQRVHALEVLLCPRVLESGTSDSGSSVFVMQTPYKEVVDEDV